MELGIIQVKMYWHYRLAHTGLAAADSETIPALPANSILFITLIFLSVILPDALLAYRIKSFRDNKL